MPRYLLSIGRMERKPILIIIGILLFNKNGIISKMSTKKYFQFLLLIVGYMAITLSCHAANDIDTVLEKKGYMIYLRPSWVFQPCVDSNKNILEAIDHSSFTPGTYSRIFGLQLLPIEGGIGKSFPGKFTDNINDRLVQDTIYYFYCKLVFNRPDYAMSVKTRNVCWFTLDLNSKTYNLGCTFVENEIKYVEPLQEDVRKQYIRYLQMEKAPLPVWVTGAELL